MSIIIKGIKMPENGETITITICDDGIVFEERKEPGSVFKAISVPERRRMSNTDRIRSMTGEELAEIMVSVCPPNYPHGDCREYEKFDGNLDCCRCWLDWLKSPVEADNG